MFLIIFALLIIIAMYPNLLTLHSLYRWLVLAGLMYAILMALNGLWHNKPFTRTNNTIRHVTATISHLQLLFGIYLYLLSPIIRLNSESSLMGMSTEQMFFRVIHIFLMVVAVVMVTYGSAKAKRIQEDHLKFKTILIWYSLALVIILVAVPWPFSPLASRPYFRHF